jgi:metal-dependent hydrolase (beta-lactamase superfamily II)
MKEKVDQILNDVKPTVLISHMDSDHYCGLDKFFPMDKRGKVVMGGIKNEKTIMPKDLESDDVSLYENKIDGRRWDKAHGEQQRNGEQNGGRIFGNILGEGDNAPSVTCFFPADNDVSGNGNEQSLMIKVAYAGKNILFPGDCSATLLEKLSKTQGFADFFKNIDVFVFSHHGDGHNGEFDLYGVVFDPSQERIPSFSVISSNPAGRNKIPKSEILGFQYKTASILKKAPEHPISIYNLIKRSAETVSASLPVYVTCNSRTAYQLVISSEGKIKVKNIGDNI